MTQRIRQALSELQAQLAYHQNVAEQLAQAISNLRGLVDGGKGAPAKATKASKVAKASKASKATKAVRKGRPKAVAIATAPSGGKAKKASLKRALQYVLEQHRKGKVPGASARQLFDDVQRAGFRFGGTNDVNNMNYLYKTLRKNAIFKRVGDGIYGLA